MSRRLTAVVTAALLIAVSAAACAPSGGEYEITERRSLEAPRPEARARATAEGRFGMSSSMQPAMTSQGGGGVDFDLPEGWTRGPGGGMRLASFGISGKSELDGSITQLSGDGGGAVANVNRWRGQVGLGPLSDADVAALPRVTVMGRDAIWVEARGVYRGMGDAQVDDALLAGAIVVLPAVSLYVKLVGPADAVEPELDGLRALAESLRLGGAKPPEVPVPSGANPHGAGGAPFKWVTPEGWVQSGPRTMRLVTLHPADDETTECYVTVLGGDGGGVVGNINRWRGQMTLAPLSDDEIADLPRLTVLGKQVPYLSATGSFAGMGEGAAREDHMLLGVFCELPGRAVSVKMTGPRDRVELERGRFEEFCRSLEETGR